MSSNLNNEFQFKNPSLLQTNPFVYGSFHECETDFAVDNPSTGQAIAQVGNTSIALAHDAILVQERACILTCGVADHVAGGIDTVGDIAEADARERSDAIDGRRLCRQWHEGREEADLMQKAHKLA